jgi:hypothetical protein
VATLATKFDLVDTELRAVKSQTTWATTEFTDVQQLAAQLDDEKLALQRQISDQAQEIESLNGEVNQIYMYQYIDHMFPASLFYLIANYPLHEHTYAFLFYILIFFRLLR